jgi:hypothetical protein
VLYGALGFHIDRCFATENKGRVNSSWPAVESGLLEDVKQKAYPSFLEQDASCWLAAGSFAGVQAEMLLHGFRFEGMFLLQDQDTKNANRYLMRGFPLDRDRTPAAGYAQALSNCALLHLGSAVESVAETLITQGEIDDDGVRAALNRVEDIKEIGRFYASEAALQGYPELIA